MFSTNDHPWPQALSIEASDAAGRRYLVDWSPAPGLPGPMGQMAKARTVAQPSQDGLERAAELALHSRLTAVPGGPASALLALKREGLIDRLRLRESPGELAKVGQLRTQADRLDASAKGLVHARARVWRLRFESDAAAFRLEPVGEAGEARREP